MKAYGLKATNTAAIGGTSVKDFENSLGKLVIDAFRALVANGLPTSYAAQAYVQLLTATNPEANVVVGSDVEPYASQGGTESLITILTNEMRRSAVPWVAGPKKV